MCKPFRRILILQVIFGTTLLLMGVLGLAYVHTAEAEEDVVSLPAAFQLNTCLGCSTQESMVTYNESDPCKTCHVDIEQPTRFLTHKEQSALEQKLDALQTRVLLYGNGANAFQKQDARYQRALENLWDAQSNSDMSLEQIDALIEQTNILLARLETEAYSGFLTQPTRQQTSCGAVTASSTLQTPNLHFEYWFDLNLDSNIARGLLHNILIDIPLRRMLAVHRRGPPSDAANIANIFNFEMNRRLSSGTNIQSPFCFRVLADMRGFQSRLDTSFSYNFCEIPVLYGLHRGLCKNFMVGNGMSDYVTSPRYLFRLFSS